MWIILALLLRVDLHSDVALEGDGGVDVEAVL
jgi:hypothetical protein